MSLEEDLLKEIDEEFVDIIGSIVEESESLEDFVKRVSPLTKLYMYNFDRGSFFSGEALSEIYKDLFFSESVLPKHDSKSSFNLEILKTNLSDIDIDGLKYKIQNHAEHDVPILRCGAVSCLMSEKFFPFQETVNYALSMKSVQRGLEERGRVLLCCVNGNLFHCI